MKKLYNIVTFILDTIKAYEFNTFHFDGHNLPDYNLVLKKQERLRC